MPEIKLELDHKPSAFNLLEDGKKIGEMVISISGHMLTVYHTEVDADQGGKGYASLLLDAMVAYVQQHNLQVIPLCPYVLAQFKKHRDLYAALWDEQTFQQ